MGFGSAMARGAVAALLCLLGLGAWARDIVVGVEAIDYSPVYGMRDDRFQGAAREILDAFAAARGHRLTFQALPVKRLYAELNRGGIDLKFPDSPDWAPALRQGDGPVFSKPIIEYIDGTIVRREALTTTPDGIHSLGTIAGFTPYAWNEWLKSGAVELKENSSFEQLLRQVQTRRIDGAYGNVAVALNAAENIAGLAGSLAFAPNLPYVADSYRLSSVKAPDVIAEFDLWLSKNPKLVAEIIARTGAEKGVR
ncbi:ABC-type amino acid transport/signal transduction systems periplasmic component/domain [Paramagnetospirillum magnetotacticum MS-1]|uniref:ABC-type amino acid transport/signal transduction systems periplasmic component/domain n=1 Tax=Paramagnetospirillum magnetotacticum MS-1 TaxID=272627 RepID=A0A0C2UZT5_PARME|nr:transporter substrate-binding domain-containing protein [Paramagnetospirillum magnetotacticum]KIL98341.1 ABC-type amino acid transport/signal transduction systems periplasmic component/domain [Paramagnetospirillum magnetotacticum MS-1]